MRGRSEPRAARVRVFIGDAAIADEQVNTAITELIAPDRRDLDLEIVRYPDDPIERVEEALRQVGMFASGRCVLLKGSLDEPAHLEWLLRFLETRFPPDAALVLVTPKIDGRSKLYRWLQEHASVEDLRVERKADGRVADFSSLAETVSSKIRANGFPAPTPGVVEAIVARAGTSPGELCNEVDRLCLAVAEGRSLTVRDVNEHVRDATAAWIFDFVDAICERQAGSALTLISDLLAGGEAPLKIVGTLSTKVAEFLIAAKYARSAKLPPPPSTASAFAKSVYPSLPETARRRFTNPYRAYHVFRVGQKRGTRSLRQLHRQLLELDLALKSGGGQPRHLLADFVSTACGRGA
jgi:DNA polymerase III delta subunit